MFDCYLCYHKAEPDNIFVDWPGQCIQILMLWQSKSHLRRYISQHKVIDPAPFSPASFPPKPNMCKLIMHPTVCVCGHRPQVGTTEVRCGRRRGLLRSKLSIRNCPDFEEAWRPEQVFNGFGECHDAVARLVPRNFGLRYSRAVQGPCPSFTED